MQEFNIHVKSQEETVDFKILFSFFRKFWMIGNYNKNFYFPAILYKKAEAWNWSKQVLKIQVGHTKRQLDRRQNKYVNIRPTP